jgi:hypothetical protein
MLFAVGLERNQTTSASGLDIKNSSFRVAKQSNFHSCLWLGYFKINIYITIIKRQDPSDIFGVLMIKSLDNRVRKTLTASGDYVFFFYYNGIVIYKCINFLVLIVLPP